MPTPAPRGRTRQIVHPFEIPGGYPVGTRRRFRPILLKRASANELAIGLRGRRGQASEVPVQWTYYLLADQAGRQLVAVFIVEVNWPIASRGVDEQLIASIQFLGEETAERPAAATR